jgi:membrane protein YdbS with pleckstrin-like domain
VRDTKCPKCGQDNSEGNLYCARCATALSSEKGQYVPEQRKVNTRWSLERDEKVIWQGKPEYWPFLLSGAGAGGAISGLLFLGFSLFWTTTAALSGAPLAFILFGSVFMLIGLFIVFGSPISQWMRYKNTEYVITDHRIITQTGAIGLDTRYIQNEWIREVYVNVSILDRIFGTGSVMVSTASGMIGAGPNAMRPSMSSLKDPYAVQKIIWDSMKKARSQE